MTDNSSARHRVVVTGIGAVSGWGWGADELWRGLAGGTAAIGVPARFDTRRHRTRLAAEVPPSPNGLAASVPGWRRFTRADRFAAAAAVEACRQAALDAGHGGGGTELGVFFGGSTAGMAEGELFFHEITRGERRRARIGLLVSHTLNAPGDAVARLLGARGPVQSLSSACASGALAIGAALDALRDGDVAVAVAGGADSLCNLTFAGFNSLRIVDAERCRPFRRQRQGLNLGEGAGVLVLETLERARRRGVRPLAELLGAGASCDAHHMTAPHPQGMGAALALRGALADAGVDAGDVGFLNAHGTGTPQNDAAEWRAIEQVFGARAPRIPVTATKGAVGHLLGSSGAIEAVATVQCLDAGAAHVAPGDGAADEDLGVDLVVGGARPLDPDCIAVSTSFGFGGANAVLVFRGWPR